MATSVQEVGQADVFQISFSSLTQRNFRIIQISAFDTFALFSHNWRGIMLPFSLGLDPTFLHLSHIDWISVVRNARFKIIAGLL